MLKKLLFPTSFDWMTFQWMSPLLYVYCTYFFYCVDALFSCFENISLLFFGADFVGGQTINWLLLTDTISRRLSKWQIKSDWKVLIILPQWIAPMIQFILHNFEFFPSLVWRNWDQKPFIPLHCVVLHKFPI